MTATLVVDRHWQLFADWCTATDQPSLPATAGTVTAFLDELPAGPATRRRRLVAIHTTHTAAGLPSPVVALAHPTADTPGPGRRIPVDVLGSALEGMQVRGWPGGLVGRRDAAILALVGAGGLTRRQVQALRTDSCPGEAAHARLALPQLAATALPGRCRACALVRWQRTVTVLLVDGWRTLRYELAQKGDTTAAEEPGHACTDRPSWPPPCDEPAVPLFMPIDRHAVPNLGASLSLRSLTSILATPSVDQLGTVISDEPKHERRPPEDLATRLGYRWAAAARLDIYESLLEEAERLADEVLSRLDFN